MDERELRRTARERYGRQIPEWIWRLLREDHYLDQDDAEGREEALSRIHLLFQMVPGAAPARQPTKRSAKPRFTPYELLRARAASEYLAKDAGRSFAVRRFREDVLGDQLLTADEAKDFLLSPAAQRFHPYQFQAAGISPARHRAAIVREHAEYPNVYEAEVKLGPPDVRWMFGRHGKGIKWLSNNQAIGEKSVQVELDGRVIDLGYWNNSVIDQLAQLVESLVANHGYPWRPVDALWFVLTGTVPSVPPLHGSVSARMSSHSNRVTATITVDPWVSAETVLAYYRAIQRQLLHRHNRPLSERRLELVRFVLRHADDRGETPPWRALMDEWNRSYRRWPYKDVRNIARDYWSAVRQVAFPRFSAYWEGAAL